MMKPCHVGNAVLASKSASGLFQKTIKSRPSWTAMGEIALLSNHLLTTKGSHVNLSSERVHSTTSEAPRKLRFVGVGLHYD